MFEAHAGSQDQPLVLDSSPLGFTQGFITASSNDSQTIYFKLMAGYDPPTIGGRIALFDPSNGTMLPHAQDTPQNITDLGVQAAAAHLHGLLQIH